MLPQEKPLNKVVIGSDEDIRRGLWKNIVERFPGTNPTFPPSPETLEKVLDNFPTKDGLEEAWSRENAHRFKGKISKRSMEMMRTYPALGSSLQ